MPPSSLQDAYSQTPLVLAAEGNHIQCIRYLCTLDGVNIRSQDLFHRSAIHWAAHNGNLDAVCDLFSAGADVSATTTSGETALHWACSSTRISQSATRRLLLEALIARGASTSQLNYLQQRPVDVLVDDDTDVIAFLLAAQEQV